MNIKRLKHKSVLYSYSLGIMCVLLVFQFVITSNTTFLKKNFVNKIISDSNYYNTVTQNAKTQISKIEKPAVLANIDIVGIIDESSVKSEFNSYIDNIYSYLYSDYYALKKDTTSKLITEKLNNHIQEHLNHQELTTQQQQDVDKYVSDVGREFRRNITSLSVYDTALPSIKRLNNAKLPIILLCILFTTILCMQLYKYSSSRRYTLRWTGCGVTAAGLACYLLGNFSLLSKSRFLNLGSPQEIFLIKSIIKKVSIAMIITSLIFLVIGFVIIIIGVNIRGRMHSRR